MRSPAACSTALLPPRPRMRSTSAAIRPAPQQRKAWLDYRQALAPDANDIFTICWTSGTTGTPKGVPRSTNHWLAISRASGDLAGLKDGDALLNPFPMVNMGGLGGFFFNWLTYRATLVLHHPLDLEVYLWQLQDEKINYTIAPPALLNMLLREESVAGRHRPHPPAGDRQRQRARSHPG